MTKDKNRIKMPFWIVCLGLFFSITVLAVSVLRTKQVMAQVEKTVKEELVVEENEEYVIIRNSRFHQNPFNLPLKNVGVYLPMSMILKIVMMKECDQA